MMLLNSALRWPFLFLVLLESEFSAATAEMFEVVGQFLKCLGLLSQVGQYLLIFMYLENSNVNLVFGY